MTFAGLKRLGVLLSQSDYYLGGKENAQLMKNDYMTEVVSNPCLSVSEKTDLLAVMMYGPEEEVKKNEE